MVGYNCSQFIGGDIMKYLLPLLVFSLLIIGCAKQPATINIPSNTGQVDTTPDVNVATVIQSNITQLQYNGKILAGKEAPYIEFNPEDYQKATRDGKEIFLYFYSDNIPWCKTDEPKILATFNDITTNKVIGFKVHFDDAVTTDLEKSLASDLKVNEAATKVILRNGTIMQKGSNTWEKSAYTKQIYAYLP